MSQARAGQRAGAEQIACVQITAVDRVVRHHVHKAPVRIAVIATGQMVPLRLRLHGGGLHMHVQRDVYAAVCAHGGRVQIRQWLRVVARAIPCTQKWREGFERHDPRRYAGGKVFRQKWAEWLVFPRLDIARGPIVEQAQTENVRRRVVERDGRAQIIAHTDVYAQFQFVIHALAGR